MPNSLRPDLFDDNEERLTLGERIGDSGEATVFHDGNDPRRLIKLHHAPNDRLGAKLAALPRLAPQDPSLDDRHRNFAWPVSTVWNTAGAAVGTVIPAVPNARSLTALGNPKLRARRAADMDWHFLHAVAANVAFLFDALHDSDIVVGDVRPENILVDDRALATLIDCDSVQMREPDGTLHLCPVGSEGFTAPEWIGRRFADGPRTAEADCFGLAALLYQLLTGAHPWTGEWMGGGDPPSRDHLIRSGDWPFKPGARLRPVPGMVSPDELAPGLAGLFRRAFIAGMKDPAARPSAGEWHEAVCIALADLDVCAERPHHHHDTELDTCPWCARIGAGLPDPFPNPPSARDPYAPLILAFERALSRGDTRMAVDLWRDNPVLSRTEDLQRLRSRMAELGDAVDSLDRWMAAMNRNPKDIRGLAALADDTPILTRREFFRHEDIDGCAIEDTVRRVAEAAIDIPPAPTISPRSSIVLEMDAAALDIPSPPPKSTKRNPTDENPLPVSYRVEGGWRGLRPARLIVSTARPGRVPALVLRDEAADIVLANVPAQRIRGSISIEFEQPDARVAVSLHTAAQADRSLVHIKAPPKRARTLGSGLASLSVPVPAT